MLIKMKVVTTVEVSMSHTNEAQPIVAQTIVTIVLPGNCTARTMDAAGMPIPPLVAKTTVSHVTAIAVMASIIIVIATAVDPRRSPTMMISATERS